MSYKTISFPSQEKDNDVIVAGSRWRLRVQNQTIVVVVLNVLENEVEYYFVKKHFIKWKKSIEDFKLCYEKEE